MKFVVSSPDSFLFDRQEFTRERSRSEQILVSLLALVAVGSQIGMFVMMQSMMTQVA